MLLQRLADEHQPGNHEDDDDLIHEETRFGLEDAVVARDVAARDEVVEVVAAELADGDSDEGREKQVSDGVVVEAVAAVGLGRLQEDGGGDVDADHPHECHSTAYNVSMGGWRGKEHELVDHAGDHDGFEERLDETGHGVAEVVEACCVVVLDLPDA